MTSRERVLKAINLEEPDRLPLDIGSTIMTSIMAQPLDRLRKYLGLDPHPVKVCEVYQMLGEVEMDVVERLGLDVLPVEPPIVHFGLRRENYKPWKLFDGTDVLMPGQLNVEVDEKGDWLLHNEGDPDQPVVARMPRDGLYFDKVGYTEMDPDFVPPSLDEVRNTARRPTDEELGWLRTRAEALRTETDKALFLGYWGGVGIGGVGSMPDFLCLLVTDKEYVRDLIALRTEILIDNLAMLWNTVGDAADIVGLDGQDFGSQRGELFSPALFEEIYFPQYCRINEWVHKNTSWATWQHTCGSIAEILPLLVESGLDAINPVQCSAEGMNPVRLKEKYGDRIAFWGGAVDTQKTLPFGSTDDVRKEAIERIRIFAPGGGFVFNPVHNIQYGTPPENIEAAYQTALEA